MAEVIIKPNISVERVEKNTIAIIDDTANLPFQVLNGHKCMILAFSNWQGTQICVSYRD